MKRFTFIKLLVVASAITCLTGCETIKKWWSEMNLTDIAKTLTPTIQTAAKYGVYAVCDNNPELRPIFDAAANGVKAAIVANAYDTAQIKQYISDALGKDNAKWVAVVYAAMDTVLAQYEIIYNKYINAELEANDKANGFKILLTALADGVIEGTKIELAAANKNAKTKDIESKRVEANTKLKLAVQKL